MLPPEHSERSAEEDGKDRGVETVGKNARRAVKQGKKLRGIASEVTTLRVHVVDDFIAPAGKLARELNLLILPLPQVELEYVLSARLHVRLHLAPLLGIK